MPNTYLILRGYITCFLWMIVSATYGQTVTGKVTSTVDGNALPGVNVFEKGTINGTITDANGVFSLSVNSKAVLVFSLVGYSLQEINLVSQSVVNVSLNQDTEVPVGYGVAKANDVAGAVTSLRRENFNRGVISTPEQLFQGRLSGVTVLPSSGEPGAASAVNIRGAASILGNSSVLYVIDGIPLDNSTGTSPTLSGIEGSSTPKNPLMFINPNDIESITILKDASSAAIYGIRSANGVILITTKNGQGTGGAGSFSFNTYIGVSNLPKEYDLLNANNFLSGVEKTNIEAGASPAEAAATIAGPPVNNGSSTNWQDQIFRTGISNGYDLSWGMSKGRSSLRLSGSYENQQGIVKNSGLERLTGKIDFSHIFFSKLKLDLRAIFSNMKDAYAPITNNAGYEGSLIGAALSFNPTNPIHNANGSFFDLGDGSRNPAAMLSYFTDNDNINRLLSNVSLSYEIVKGLTAKATLGYNNSSSLRKSFADPRVPLNWNLGTTNVFGVNYNNPIPGNGRAVYQNLSNLSVLAEGTMVYDKKFVKSAINMLIGYSNQTFEVKNYGDVGWGLTTPVTQPTDNFVKDINNFTKLAPAYAPSYTNYAIQSYFSRINYSIHDKYYFTGTVRIDNSSIFIGNKSGAFPGLAAKWKILKESFGIDALGKLFSDFSIRANFGQMGNQNGLDPNAAINYYQTWIPYGQTTSQSVFIHPANNSLKWGVSSSLGVGLDWATLNNRLVGTIDYFHTDRKNPLFFGPVPEGGFGGGPILYTNLSCDILNTGLEFSMEYKAIIQSKFNWAIAYNMTFYHNEVNNLSQPITTGVVYGQGLAGNSAQILANNQPLFSWNMPTFQGYDANGFSKYANGAKYQVAGSALPNFTAGLANNFKYGNWGLSLFLTTSRGFSVYNNTANALFLKGNLMTAHNVTYDAANSTENPRNPGAVSTRFLENGDFIRLSNAQLNYNFNVKGKVIKSLSANIAGQNLFLITSYSGLDPEINVNHNLNGTNGTPSQGFDYTGYPRPRTFTLGVSMVF